jgi:acetyl esterase/lipase
MTSVTVSDGDILYELISPSSTDIPKTLVTYVHGGAWLSGTRLDMLHMMIVTHQHHPEWLLMSPEYTLGSIDDIGFRGLIIMTIVLCLLLSVAFGHQKRVVIATLLICSTVLILTLLRLLHEDGASTASNHPSEVAECIHHVMSNHPTVTNVILLGHSAGGHISALLATNDLYGLTDVISGLVLLSAPLVHAEMQRFWLRHLLPTYVHTPVYDYDDELEDMLEDVFERWPCCSVHTGMAPVFIANADVDFSLHRHTNAFIQLLRNANVYYEHANVTGTHFTIRRWWDSSNEDFANKVMRFIENCCCYQDMLKKKL